MTNLKTLEKKVNDLEERLKKIEDIVISPTYTHDKDYMDALYNQAKDLVVKHKKASVIFLQRKLLIDYQRAVRLLQELQMNGVVGSAKKADRPMWE